MISFTQASPEYPAGLHAAHPPPETLWAEGSLEALQQRCISVIGSRKMSAYGQAVIHALLPPLIQAGLTIVSGLAYGVDSEAHRVVLEQKGRGVAVLGGGLHRIYPARHTGLAQALVAQGGLLLSEYEPDTLPRQFHFPARNRIIAALSPVLLIIEAGLPSGTASTAQAALEMGRDVCVVPADITRTESAGTLQLLKQGARPITEPSDLLALYQLQLPIMAPLPLKPALTGSPATLYACISHGIHSMHGLLRATGWQLQTLQATLSILELDGYISYRNNQWQKTSLS